MNGVESGAGWRVEGQPRADVEPGLASHPGVGFVLVYSEARGHVVLGPKGYRDLDSGTVGGDVEVLEFAVEEARSSGDRLLLREDNADLRLSAIGHALGLISDERYENLLRKDAIVANALARLGELNEPAAFPGWFRQVIRTEASRLTRRRRAEREFDLPAEPPAPVADDGRSGNGGEGEPHLPRLFRPGVERLIRV